MLQLTAAQEAALQTIIEGISPALSNAFSEAAGSLVLVDEPVFEETPTSAHMASPDPVLQTGWTYSGLGPGEAALVLSAADALGLAAHLAGASAPEPELDQATAERITPLVEAIVRGLGIAIGNAANRAFEAESIHISICPLTLGAPFTSAGDALSIRAAYRVQNGPDGVLTFLLSPAAAALIAGEAGGTGIAASPSAASHFAGDAQATAPTAPMPDFGGPAFGAAGGGFGGAPVGAGPLGGPFSQPASPFQTLSPFGGASDSLSRSMDLIMDIPLEVSVELGRVQMLIKDVLELATGSIVELERVAGEPVDLLVNGQLIAKGEVVVIEDNFGIRLTEIVSPADRLHGMSKRAA